MCLSATVPGLSVSVTGLLVILYGLSVSLPGLSVTNFPDSGTQTCKLSDWPRKVTGLSGTVTDVLVKVTDRTVCFHCQSLSTDLHIWDKPDT